MAIVVLRLFCANFLQQRARLFRFLFPQQALAQMGAGIDVVGIPLQRCAVTRLRLVQFALLKINIAELRMMMRFVQVMDLRLKFLDAATVVGARQFKSACGRRHGAIDEKEIENGVDEGKEENEQYPHPFFPANGIDQHPELKQ